MGLNDRLARVFARIDLKRRFPGYKFHKWLFYSWMVLLVVLVVSLGSMYGWGVHSYTICEQRFCTNPLYDMACGGADCQPQILRFGEEVGQPVPKDVANFWFLLVFGTGIVFLLNHMLNKVGR